MNVEGGSVTGPRIEVAGSSHVGKVRARNEDVIAFDAWRGWMVLADGMGGYQGGDVAARLAVDTVMSGLENSFFPAWSARQAADALLDAVCSANIEIYRASLRNSDLAFMGSTIVAALFVEESLVCVHLGDSRMYRIRGASGVLELLTRDHTVLQEEIDAGLISADDARLMGARGPLTRGLGVAADATPEITRYAVDSGDVFLLCSDGLTDMLSADEIRSVLVSHQKLDEVADALITAANLRGGRDNVSVVLARMVV